MVLIPHNSNMLAIYSDLNGRVWTILQIIPEAGKGYLTSYAHVFVFVSQEGQSVFISVFLISIGGEVYSLGSSETFHILIRTHKFDLGSRKGRSCFLDELIY